MGQQSIASGQWKKGWNHGCGFPGISPQNEYQKAVDYAAGKNFEGLNKNRDMLLGKCYYRLKNYDKALEYFEKSNYKLSELNNAEAYEIGYSYFVNKNCIKSSELFEKIANAGDVLAQSASYNLAECFLKVGKKQNAFKYITSVEVGLSFLPSFMKRSLTSIGLIVLLVCSP